MSVNEIIDQLPHLSFEERQLLISEALELDNPPLSAVEEQLVERRLAEHHLDPKSAIDLDEFKRSI
jgi:methyl coenzyme M reductase subunit C-like uncharacterized protein (methanogenesis marker protein 7)